MNLPELLDWVARYDTWIYALLLAYCVGKTGPLPMVAGYAAAQGVLQLPVLLLVTVVGSIVGGQLRFAVGRWASPWICQRLPGAAPWMALASAGVERYSQRVLLLYRFVKGMFSLVGLGAGASLIAWRRFAVLDALGASLCIGSLVGIGWSLGQLGAVLHPQWAAYTGLSLLVLSMLGLFLFGKHIKHKLLPVAEKILAERAGQTGRSAPV